jgi:hypothetical protein
MALTVDRSILLQASWANTVRLARWIGAKRMPTCSCPGCRAVVVGALERYFRARPWDEVAVIGPRAESARWSIDIRSSKKRKSRSSSTHACSGSSVAAHA